MHNKMNKKVLHKLVAIIVCAALLLLSVPLSTFAETESESESGRAEDGASFENGISTGSEYVLKTADAGSLELKCKSAILMEASTGTVLYEQNADERLPPASVTKIMTLLLIMEAVEAKRISLSDTVTVSAHASSMGGSQIFLKEGEEMTVEELLKSVIIASANDAAVALAEYTFGNEESFVAEMNKRARELGMDNTVFENTNGLDDTVTEHLTTARDIAIMSRELIKYPKIIEYSSKWMDTVRDGAFGLTNTNRLVRFYRGCTGLKTGSTSKAGFCVSATAERDGMELICVIMGAETRDIRNAAAVSLLDWGFANYGIYVSESGNTDPITVKCGIKNICNTEYSSFSCVLSKGDISLVTTEIKLSESLNAPIKKGDIVGSVTYKCSEKIIGTIDIKAAEGVERIGYFDILARMLTIFTLKSP